MNATVGKHKLRHSWMGTTETTVSKRDRLIVHWQERSLVAVAVNAKHTAMRMSSSAEDATIFVLTAKRIGPDRFFAKHHRIRRSVDDVREATWFFHFFR